ncbi:diguanylate cyclase [Fictibacillus sp. UD]|uniref:GGDEF domain-containing response regulator n=1 Tax=Fictibacillus sp. UD TaxID=3038777 RepID=UPI0037455301
MEPKIKKYQLMLQTKINRQIEEWKNSKTVIQNKDLYQFVHTITGTAGTISLHEVSMEGAALMNQLNKEEDKNWEPIDVMIFLRPLTALLTDEKLLISNSVPSQKSPQTVDDNEDQPLILVVDPDISYLIDLKEELEKLGWSVFISQTADKAISMVYDLQPDCIVIDHTLHEKEVYSFLKQIRESISHQLIPVIVMSTTNNKLARLQAYELGADDFMEKTVENDEFLVRIKRQLARRKLLKESLMKDELTKVFNRKFLNDIYMRMSAEHERKKISFTLAILDLDHFKKINDSYGHSAGDQVLVDFAVFLRAQLRRQDVIIRYGGEEFIVLMPYTSSLEAEQTVSRLLEQVKVYPFSYDNYSFSITFSAGISEISNTTLLSNAINVADRALYAAKENGRARVETAQGQIEKKRKLKVAVIDDSDVIRKMLESFFKEFEVEKYELEVQTYQDGVTFFEDTWHKTHDEFLIILDGVLPKMDGIEILQKIRQYPDRSRYTILMLTARKAEADIVRALNLGADDYLTKPFSIRELEARIKVLVQRVK